MNTSNNTTECSPFSPHQSFILNILALSGGSISLLFCLIILLITILFHKYQESTQRVILYLTISVSISSVAYIFHGANLRHGAGTLVDDAYCVAVAFIDQVSTWMVLFAICCLTVDLFVKVVFVEFDTSRFEPAYCITIFILPLTFNWIPFIKHGYGPAGSICWIKLTSPENCSIDYYYLVLRFVLYWIPFLIILLLVFVANLIIFMKTRHRLRAFTGNFSPDENVTKQLLYREVRWYLIYPVLLSIMFAITVISRLAEAINTDRPFFVLRIIHILGISLQGAMIAVVLALDYDTRRQLAQYHSIKMACYNLLCCCKQHRVSEYEIVTTVKTDSLHSEKSIQQNLKSISDF